MASSPQGLPLASVPVQEGLKVSVRNTFLHCTEWDDGTAGEGAEQPRLLRAHSAPVARRSCEETGSPAATQSSACSSSPRIGRGARGSDNFGKALSARPGLNTEGERSGVKEAAPGADSAGQSQAQGGMLDAGGHWPADSPAESSLSALISLGRLQSRESSGASSGHRNVAEQATAPLPAGRLAARPLLQQHAGGSSSSSSSRQFLGESSHASDMFAHLQPRTRAHEHFALPWEAGSTAPPHRVELSLAAQLAAPAAPTIPAEGLRHSATDAEVNEGTRDSGEHALADSPVESSRSTIVLLGRLQSGDGAGASSRHKAAHQTSKPMSSGSAAAHQLIQQPTSSGSQDDATAVETLAPRRWPGHPAPSQPPHRTTVMLRNLPNNYTRTRLIDLLNSVGFAGRYDFLYLPIDFRTHAALGYAFVNFVSAEDAERSRQRLDGFSRWALPSNKVLSVGWSQPHQGLAAHIARYRNSPLMHETVPETYRPVLFSNGVPVPFPPPTKKIKPPRQGTERMLV